MTDEVDMDELTERAKVLAEATGRTVEDVMADLLDDGILNESNREKDEPKDLITQLKEAAALITTVQEINKEVSENKVLNGGENKTDVKIETTLEGDIVDRAIASAQRKADDLKKLIATLVPVFLLLTGGSLEAFGVIDVLGSDGDDGGDDDIYIEYGGCMAAPDSGSGAPAQAADVAHGSPPPVPTAWVQDLATLHQLLRAGALSDAEFQAAKAKLLAMVVLLHTALKHFLRGLPIKARMTCIISCIITLYVWHYMTISEVDSQ